MKQATTPTILLRTKKDLSECTEVRVALTRSGETTPRYIKSLSQGTLTVAGSNVVFRLSQAETTALKGTVVIDLRIVTADNTVIGFMQGYVHVNESYDTVEI